MTSFLERQNTFLRLLRISHKGRILQKNSPVIICSSLMYASIGGILSKIGATGESVEQFEITSFLEKQNTFLVFCEYLIKEASYTESPIFIIYSPLKCASISSCLNKIGDKGESVEQFEITSYLCRQNTLLCTL